MLAVSRAIQRDVRSGGTGMTAGGREDMGRADDSGDAFADPGLDDADVHNARSRSGPLTQIPGSDRNLKEREAVSASATAPSPRRSCCSAPYLLDGSTIAMEGVSGESRRRRKDLDQGPRPHRGRAAPEFRRFSQERGRRGSARAPSPREKR